MGRVLKAGTFDYPTVMHFFYCEKETKKKAVERVFFYLEGLVSRATHTSSEERTKFTIFCVIPPPLPLPSFDGDVE